MSAGVRRDGVPAPARRYLVFAVAAALAAGGCGRESGSAGAGWLDARAQPVTLELTLDSAHSVSRTMGGRGGTLIATGADGTRYRLRIPEGALQEPTVITMSPVAAVTGLPLGGGSVAAVHLEPDGLRLARPATLSITPATDVPVQEQVAYAYFGNGRDAHRYPLGLERERVEMQVHHFSGYGFGRAAPGDPGRAMLERAAAYEARLSARVAAATTRDREAGHTSISAETLAMLWEAYTAYYDVVLRPLMRKAERDDRMAVCCLVRYHDWERNIQLLTGADADESGGGALPPELVERRREAASSRSRILATALEQGMQRAIRRCREESDLSQVVTMVALVRDEALRTGESAAVDAVFEHVRRCLTFDVEFRSAFDNRAPANTRFTYDVAAHASVQVDPRTVGEDLVSAPLVYERYLAEGNPKEAVAGRDGADPRRALFDAVTSARVSAAGTRPGRFTVRSLRWAYRDVDRPGTDCDGADATMKRDSVVDMTIVFTIAEPVELTRHVPRIGGSFVTESPGWMFHWSQARARDEVDPPREYDGERTYAVVLSPVARGEWRVTFDDASTTELGFSLQERGRIVLRHEPQ